MRNYFIGLLVLCWLPACQNGIKTEAAFYRWLNDPENGLVQSRQIGDLQLSVKYLPVELLVYRELKGSTLSLGQLDSLRSRYQQSHTFLLTVKPSSAGQGRDVMYRGVESYQAYKERVMKLNFNLPGYISLKDGDKELKPLLHTLENTYSATEGRSLYLVFENKAGSRTGGEELDFVFTDQVFGTGISHFRFLKSDLEETPLIQYASVR